MTGKGKGGGGADLVILSHADATYRHLVDKRSRGDALEGQPGAGLEESEVFLLTTAGCCPVAADAVAGAVAAVHLLPPPQLGLRGALTGQKASLGCRLSQACVCTVHSICTEYLYRVFVQSI